MSLHTVSFSEQLCDLLLLFFTFRLTFVLSSKVVSQREQRVLRKKLHAKSQLQKTVDFKAKARKMHLNKQILFNFFFRLGTHLYMSLFLLVRLSFYPSVCLSVQPAVCPSIHRAPYFRNRTSCGHYFWCTCVK